MTDQPRPMRAGRRAAVAGLALVLVLLAATATWAASAWKARGWFDAPLPGAVLPLAPYPVVLHAADDSGVAQVRWLVDGVPSEVQPVTTAGDLVTVSWVWEPASLGPHMLTAVVQGQDGSLSDPVSVGVTVSADAEAQPTPELSPSLSPIESPAGSATPRPSGATTAPTPTSRPTVAPTATPRPTPPAPTPSPSCVQQSPTAWMPDLGQLTIATPTFEWFAPETLCPGWGYRLIVSETFDLASPVAYVLVANDVTVYDLPDPLPNLTRECDYFWTVVSEDPDGNQMPMVQSNWFVVEFCST